MKKSMKSEALRMEKEEKKGPVDKGCKKHGKKNCATCKEAYKEDHETMNK
jgi:hypothetical protein